MAFLLFTIVIISLLAAALMRLNNQSAISNAHQVISTRAFFAAESGAQLQALTIYPVIGASLACTEPGATTATHNFTTDGLKSCKASITQTCWTVGGNDYFQIVSVGQCNTGQLLQATRTIEVRLKDVK